MTPECEPVLLIPSGPPSAHRDLRLIPVLSQSVSVPKLVSLVLGGHCLFPKSDILWETVWERHQTCTLVLLDLL